MLFRSILEAIKITEEKNARIFIQVLDNCLEYKNHSENEHEIFMLVLITVLFVRYNLIFRMKFIKIELGFGIEERYLPNIINNIPMIVRDEIILDQKNKSTIESLFIYNLKKSIEPENEKKEENIKEIFKYIENNKIMLFQLYKYNVKIKYFKEEDKELIEKLNNFVESGILK